MTVATALSVGFTRTQLRSGQFRHLMWGVVVPTEERVTLNTWVQAGRLVLGPDAVTIGRTALQIHGLDMGDTLPVRFATRERVRSRRLQLDVVHIPDLTTHGIDQPVKDALLTELPELKLKQAVALCDRVLQRRLTTAPTMNRWTDEAPGPAAIALGLARPGAESIPETHVRLCIALAGLPEPKTQVTVRNADGFVGRFDMAIEEYGVLIEYEGDYRGPSPRATPRWVQCFVT